MSALPGSPQAPAAPSAAPTIADIIGSPPPNVGLPGQPAIDVAPASNPINDLGSAFGVTGTDAAATAAALRPVLELMAQAAPRQQQQQQQPPQQQQQQFHPQQPPQQQAPGPLDFSDIDLGDASPEVARAFRALSERSQAAINAATQQANQIQQTLYRQQHQQHAATQQAEAQQQAQVTQRAVSYIDTLASPKYGVGQNRTMVQTIAAEQVMATAGRLINGMQAYGKVLPIEQVMQAAILMVDGALPTPAVPGAPLVPALGQLSAPGAAPPVRRQVGSSGGGQVLMSDNEFLDGARAILAR